MWETPQGNLRCLRRVLSLTPLENSDRRIIPTLRGTTAGRPTESISSTRLSELSQLEHLLQEADRPSRNVTTIKNLAIAGT